MLKKNLMITLAIATTATVTIGGSISLLSTDNKSHKTIKQSQITNFNGNYINNINEVTQSINKNTDKKYENKNEITENKNEEVVKETKVYSEKDLKTNNKGNNNQQEKASFESQEIENYIQKESEVNSTKTPEVIMKTIDYDRTTSIYANDNITLLRVEYYVNNKLMYYSSVEQFDSTTHSYIEKIYEAETLSLIRTDIYSNGNLVKSY